MKRREKVPNHREAVILRALLHGEKYGLQIRDEVEKLTGKPMPFGSLYVTLDRMTAHGFLKSREGESNPERGGNRRRYFRITGDGVKALNQLQQMIGAALPQGGLTNG